MAEKAAKKKGKGGLKSFFSNLGQEFKKIVWPDKKKAAKQTAMVIIAGIVIGLVIVLLDTAFQALLSLIA